MFYRTSQILAPESIAVAGTKVLDINLGDPISRLMLITKLTNADSDPTGHPAEAITKIELVDGSDVLFSMDGSQAIALDFFGTGVQPSSMLDYLVGEWSMSIINIPFGRWLWDEELALDPKRFNNLQLKITHNLALGSCTPTVGTMAVWADVFDQKSISPMGFLTAKSHYQFTQVANTTFYVDLPTDLPLRLLMFGAHNSTEAPEYNITNLKLTEEHDKHIILEGTMEQLSHYAANFYPPWTEKMYGLLVGTTANAFYGTPTWERTCITVLTGAAGPTISLTGSAGQILTLVGSAGTNFEAIVSGHNPFGMFPVVFGKKDVINDAWQLQQVGSGRLQLVCSAGPDVSETMEVLIQQIRGY